MSAELYRDYALDCLRLAETTTAPDTKATLLGMAQCWVKLADQAEKNSQTDIVYAPPPLRLVT
jgi:hypothetical protein